eukprot:760200-Hanusia_phi.AAC.3
MENEKVEKELVSYHSQQRKGGAKDRIERVWRHCVHHDPAKEEEQPEGKKVVFEQDWRIPSRGRLLLDFVHIVRPPPDSVPVDEDTFRCRDEGREEREEGGANVG